MLGSRNLDLHKVIGQRTPDLHKMIGSTMEAKTIHLICKRKEEELNSGEKAKGIF